ncbi:MAG: hypothetical protein EA420_13240 [Candidatus Competibacteraceae bacterium]|nr:MAG: hypothetical protein EA420_13240 [Candidatus Competibacteraceae bacterium]
MKTVTFLLTGISPLIMQSDALADPLNEIAKAIKAITSKQKKTDEDHARIGQLEFRGGLYFDEKVGPHIPAKNIERMLRDAGALSKLGRKVRMGLQVVDDFSPLGYIGPRDLAGLEKARAFHDRRTVVVKTSRTVRERPIFRDWTLEVNIAYDEGVFNKEQIVQLMDAAGRYIGLGTYRPRYGRFDAKVKK